MDFIRLTTAINQLLLAQSNEERREVLLNNPELLTEQTIQEIFLAVEESKRNGLTEQADGLIQILALLQELKDTFGEASFEQSDSSSSAKSEVSEPEIAWAKTVRKYLVLREIEFVRQATTEAKFSNDPEIIRLLEGLFYVSFMRIGLVESQEHETEDEVADFVIEFAQQASTKFCAEAETCADILLAQNRIEESLTARLLSIDNQIMMTERFVFSSPDEQIKNLQNGIQHCLKAIEIARTLKDSFCIAFYSFVAASGFYHAKRFDEAENYSVLALEEYRKVVNIEPFIYKQEAAQSLTHLGVIYEVSGKYEQAKNAYQEALNLFREINANREDSLELRLATLLFNLGGLCIRLEEFEEALGFLSEALEQYETHGFNRSEKDASRMAVTLISLGIAQKKLNRYNLALESQSKGIGILEQLTEKKPEVYGPQLASAFVRLGNTYSELKRSKEAIDFCQKGLEIYERLAKRQPEFYEKDYAETLHNLGAIQYRAKQFIQSIESFKKALEIFRSIAEKQSKIYETDVANTLYNLANAQADLKQFADSKDSYLKSLEIRKKLARQERQVNEPEVALTLGSLGYLAVEEENFGSAKNYFEEARTIVESAREEIIDLKRKENVFRERIGVYWGLLTCYVKTGDWKKALEIAEQSKSRSLADLLNLKIIRPKVGEDLSAEEKAELTSLADDYGKLIQKIKYLTSYLTALYQSQNEVLKSASAIENNSPNRSESEQMRQSLEQQIKVRELEISRLKNDRDTVLTKIKKYDSNFPPRTELLSHEDILKVSKESGKTIVIFRATHYGTYVSIIFPDGTTEHLEVEEFTAERLAELIFKFSELVNESGEKVYRSVDGWLYHYDQFRAAYAALFESETSKYDLRKRAAYDEAFAGLKRNWSDVLQNLYSELVGYVHTALRKKNQYKDVLFVPNGALAILPLHACFWEENGERKYLLDDLTISYATSVSVFKHALSIEQDRQREDKFLFVTNPDESLRFSDQEVDAISAIFSRAAKNDLRRSEATRETVIREMAGGGYSQLHFSCHGSYDWSDPFASPLMMADGFLTVAEIMQIDVKRAWLVTLSACETGMVDFRDASDEHYGFPLGFIFAGCPSVWGTLWSVDDEKTSELMQSAYEFIKKGKSKAESLKRAQIAFRKKYEKLVKEGAADYSSPYYWAAFQHYGV